MKKIISSLLLFSIISNAAFSQTVSGSIRKGTTTNVLEVLAKPTANINAQVGNINITFSIPDQGASNPTDASITKATNLNNATLIPTDGNNPYIISGRAYYSYLLLQSSTASDVPSALTANTDNLIATFTFTAPYNTGIRLDDLTSSGGGPNFQMTWYVQFNQGVGDVTDYTNPFYGYYNVGDAVNNGGTGAQYVTLVVKFVDFTAIKNNNSAILNWSVESEGENTASYEIQKSLDGINFTPVKNIAALNNGRTSNSYSTTVENLSAIRSAGYIYFRIKQTDRDGKFVYSVIRNVRVDSKGFYVGVYPNPVKNTANVNFDLEANGEVAVSLIDATGKQLFVKQLQGIKGANLTQIDMSNMATGSYILKVQSGTDVKVIPVVKAEN